jgi:D-inositol-3-phosphate glycosyltransferase
MRVAMISEHANPLAELGGVDAGGQNVHVAALSAALGRRGHEVTVYTRRDDPALPDRVAAWPGVEVVHVTAGPAEHIPKDELLPHIPALALGTRRDWQRSRPDVVHGHFWMSGIAALEAVRMAGLPRIPVVETFHALGTVKRRHQGAEDTSPAERETLEPLVATSVDTVLATCSDEVRELLAMDVDERRIRVAPCGVDLDLLRPEGPVEAAGERRRIGVVGRLVPRKGVDIAIRALALLRSRGIADLELIVVGGPPGDEVLDDPEVRRLQGIAREAGVADRVVFRGGIPHAELPAVLRSFEAVVCTPWYEPFGIVPLEAMACGIPVVGAAVGGLLDTVVDGVTGLSVPPRDPWATAAAVERLLMDPELARALGGNARRRVEAGYTWESVARLTEEAYVAAALAPAVPHPRLPL